jgi:competence protein ComEA
MSSTSSKIAFGIVCFLFLLLIAGGIILGIRTLVNQPAEITINSPQSQYTYEINVSGDVLNPGIYSVTDNDTISSLLNTAGLPPNAESLSISLSIKKDNGTVSPQKININTAELWLLEYLPGIGEGKAQAIIDYRNRNGKFHSIYELQQVNGISAATVQKIKDYITVGDI